MNKEDKQGHFLTQLTLSFPETITYNPEGKSSLLKVDNAFKTLKRRILFIDDNENFKNIPENVDRYCISKSEAGKDNETSKEMLNQFLGILDINLGETYELVSNTIYENKLPWKTNKWDEMLSPDLIYISYGVEDTDHNTFEPFLYLSFMLTEEIDISKTDFTELVVYLYEIQLLPSLRGQGIGQKMIQYLKDTSIQYNQIRSHDDLISSIALTVFSSNEPAFRFYNKLGFKFTAGSPRDEKIVSIANRTRRRLTQNTIENPSDSISIKGHQIIKPIYYLLYLPF